MANVKHSKSVIPSRKLVSSIFSKEILSEVRHSEIRFNSLLPEGAFWKAEVLRNKVAEDLDLPETTIKQIQMELVKIESR
jgi:hypothetical protein